MSEYLASPNKKSAVKWAQVRFAGIAEGRRLERERGVEVLITEFSRIGNLSRFTITKTDGTRWDVDGHPGRFILISLEDTP